jgi:hypothetical protein
MGMKLNIFHRIWMSGNSAKENFSILKKLRGLSLQENYTDRATAACRRS